MKKIHHTMKNVIANSDFQKRYKEMKREILAHPDIQAFINKHEGQITEKMLHISLGKLYEYISQTTNCHACPNLNDCVNLIQGFEPALVIRGGVIDIDYHRCKRKIIDEKRRETEKLIQSIFVPTEILQASLAHFTLDSKGRMLAFERIEAFAASYQQGKKMKGLYLHGSFGVGKSYLLGALANQLAEKQISSLLVYVPEFLREMKQSIGDQTLAEKIDTVKKAPILMLDDIGAEVMSSWTRDEVLGTILQFRMHEHLPTFFTSNFNLKELEHHLTYSQRGEEEKMKAARMIERIKSLAEPIKVDGYNRRSN
ncbi:primosomal protein DnaI [Bacillus chungangensis]|uniref:primosomal protein DnaI n=1 Tax=Bacillus chungangensis TaxID=587633 RepID=UPI0027D842E2|nr:primosomal protein DnaI [Bacillus chungangensis]